ITIVGALFITNLMIVLLTVEFDSCVEEERKKMNERRAEEKKLRRLQRERLKAKQEAALFGMSLLGESGREDDSERGGGDGTGTVGGNSGDGSSANNVGGLSFASRKSVGTSGSNNNNGAEERLDDPFATDSDADSDEDGEGGGGDVLSKFGNFLQKQLDSDRRIRSVSLGAHTNGSTRRGSQDTASLRGSQAASLRRSSHDRSSSGGGGGKGSADRREDGGGSDNNSNPDADDAAVNAEDDDDPLNPAASDDAAAGLPGFLSAKRIAAPTKKLSKLQVLRKNMRGALYSQTGLLTINVLILGNMVVLGAVHYGMSETMKDVLDLLNFAFTIVFTVEVVYRLFCIDIWNFVRSTMSMLDLLVVILSWIDYSVPSISFPIIRGIRVIRLLNVFKPFPNVYKWIKVIVRSLKSSVVLFIMCSFFTLIFAVFGMSLFGGRFCNFADGNVLRPDNTVPWCPNRPRSNYDTLVQALLTSFQIMTGDDWYLIMVNGMRARGGSFSLFFVANYVIGNMVLLNLLIGILLSVRTATDEDARRKTALSEKRIAQARAESDFTTVAMLEERAEFKRKRFALISFKTDEERRAEKAAANQRLYTEYSKVELRVQELVESTPFRYTVLIMTIINTIGLALQSPFNAPDTPAELVLMVIELATNAFFVLELLLECLAYGIFLNPKSYLKRDRWNIFDLAMVVVFLVTQIWTAVTKSQGQAQLILRALSALRALRPIRFVAESKGMKLVIKSLSDSVGPLGNLMIVILIVMTLFGIMGVQIFQGLFYYCNGTDALINYNDLNAAACEAVGGRWSNAAYNFDHLGQAYLTLFVLATTEGWSTIMFNGMDATDTFNEPPIVNIQKKNSVYFIAFIVIGAIFFVNLFVSIIIDSFQQAQRHDPSGGGGSQFLTKQQNAWIRSQHTMLNHVAIIDYDGVITVQDVARSRFNAVRGLFRYICRHPLFDVFIYCCVFVNFLVMAVEEYPQSDSMEVFGSVTNIFFTSIFSLEVILRLIAESPRRYMASKWNRFDLLVVFLSLLSLLFELIFANATFVSFFRSMRALRLLRLLRKSRRLQAVLRKFLMAMYSLTNIGGILFLVLFCYGLIGMKLFGRLVYDGTIDHNANFQNIFSAFLLMLRVATGGNWGDILYSCTQSEAQGYCLDRLGDCGINIVGQIFFLTFVVLATFVLLNVFVAVILDVFTSMTGEIDILSAWDASQFMKLWFHFDPERTYRMESRFLLTLLRHIPASCVLGMGNVPVRRRLQHELVFVESLMLEEHDGKVELQDLIHALCDRAFRKVRSNMNEETAGVGGGGRGGDDDEAGKLDPLPIERARHLKQK
ncbi:voltage-gated ion channel protein, putative, partial [Bodo saltans]